MKNLSNVFIAVFFALIAIGSGVESEPEISVETSTDVVITAYKLYNDYQSNEIAADQSYKGKVIEVTGVIRDIGNDLMDEPYITLAGDEFIGDVQCYLKNKSDAINLSKGQFVKVKGLCDGLFMNVLVQGAIILE